MKLSKFTSFISTLVFWFSLSYINYLFYKNYNYYGQDIFYMVVVAMISYIEMRRK